MCYYVLISYFTNYGRSMAHLKQKLGKAINSRQDKICCIYYIDYKDGGKWCNDNSIANNNHDKMTMLIIVSTQIILLSAIMITII